jgi:hypothetical protein
MVKIHLKTTVEGCVGLPILSKSFLVILHTLTFIIVDATELNLFICGLLKDDVSSSGWVYSVEE